MRKKARGGATISLMIIIIIVGAVLLVGGIFPKTPQNTEAPQEAILDQEAFTKLERKSLQLETLKFKQCATTAAVNFLVDNSGSMARGSKMPDLKNGLRAFAASFPDSGVIGLQAYNEPGKITPEGYEELVPISRYLDVKSNFNNAVERMSPSGFTYSKNAMAFSKIKLEEGKAKFPEYKFNLVFISDGIPETASTNGTCGYSRCFAEIQNPESVATEIKNMGIRIFTLAYLDDSDTRLKNELQNMMTNVASSPDDYFLAPVSNQIEGILAQIGQKLCE